jgi:hypothetical protein
VVNVHESERGEMKMLAQAHQSFVEADLAYRRERAANAFRDHPRRTGATWARIRAALRNRSDLRGGQALPGADRSIVQPNGWDPASYVRPATSPHH